MAIIEKSRIISKEAEKPFNVLLAEYDKLEKKNRELISSMTDLQKAYVNVKKTNDGSEAKKLINLNKELETANKKLIQSEQEQNKQLQLIKAATAQANKEAKEAAQFALKQKGAYDRLTKATLEAQKQFKNLATQYGANSKQAKAARKEFEKLDNKLSAVNRAARDGKKDVGRYGLALKGVGRQLLGSLGVVAGVSTLINVLKKAGQIFISFEKKSSKLAAILGKTKDEITALTKQAKELGATTVFTASEVLEADTALAKLGFTATQIEKAIPGVLSLAAATGQDLASSAELAAATLRIFNLDASEMGRVSDVLAKSTTISSLSMEKLATIMPIVGKTAQLAGVSLERTAALAGTLTDRGLDASTAATSLRNIFLELSKKGLTWNEAMQKINSSTDKNRTALNLFGKRAAAAGAILAETSSDTDRLTISLENATGAAQEMAEVMLDNLAGDITKAQSAWEGFILSLEDGNGVISKILRTVTNKFTDLLTMLKKLNEGESLYLQKLKKDSDFQGQVNKRWEEYNHQILLATTEEKKLFFIQTKKSELQNKIRGIQYKLNKGIENGIKISGRRRAELEFEVHFYDELIARLKNYDKESEAAGKVEDENTTKIEESVKIRGSRISQYQKDIDYLDAYVKKLEEQRRAEIALMAAEIERRNKLKKESGATSEISSFGIQGALDIIPLQSMIDAENNARDEQRKRELEKELELQEAKKQITETAIDEATNYAINAAGVISDSKLNKETSRIEAEKDLLKNQLDKGLINETQYQTKLDELNKKQNLAEARAARRKALYEIAINTAIAVVKALPNLIKAGAVATIGAVKAAFVAATPLPKFAKGTKFLERGKNPKGTDTIPILANEGERIVPSDINKMLGDIPNEDLPKLLKDKSSPVISNRYLKQLVGLMSNMAYAYNYNDQTIIVPVNGSGKITMV